MNCDTCKHENAPPYDPPCGTCRWDVKGDRGSNWEPKRMSIDDCTPDEWSRASKAAHDPVTNPAHYTFGSIECLDYIEDVLTREEYIGFLRGQVIKYQHRLTRKGDPGENAEKLAFYADRLAAKLAQLYG